MDTIGWINLALFVLVAVTAVAAWLYEFATNEVGLLRTGAGGQRVVIEDVLLAVPYFHESGVFGALPLTFSGMPDTRDSGNTYGGVFQLRESSPTSERMAYR